MAVIILKLEMVHFPVLESVILAIILQFSILPQQESEARFLLPTRIRMQVDVQIQ
jgi:hypothetical protein